MCKAEWDDAMRTTDPPGEGTGGGYGVSKRWPPTCPIYSSMSVDTEAIEILSRWPDTAREREPVSCLGV